jgi:hypothetical protein
MSANQVSAARLSVDMRVWSLLLGEARRRALTRTFGVPGDEQSFVVTVLLLGAGGAVLAGLVPHPSLHASRADAAIGGTLVNAGLRGVAGAPSQAMPLAGALIAFAVVGHAIRPTVAEAIHDARAFTHRVRSTLAARYRT